MESLKNKVLKKKELAGIDESFVEKVILEVVSENKKVYDTLLDKSFNERSKEFDFLLKKIRKKLRVYHGSFTKSFLNENEKKVFLEKVKQNSEPEHDILKRHQSTYERLPYYKEVYELIGEDDKILDLGCGYNPFSYFLISDKDFICSDINDQEIKFINEYFKIKNINGKALIQDLTNEEELKKIKSVSKGRTILLFKVLDTLESFERNYSKKLLDNLFSDKIIVSFPLKSLGGKKEMKTKRTWFENMITSFDVEKIVIGEELYYILKKKY